MDDHLDPAGASGRLRPLHRGRGGLAAMPRLRVEVVAVMKVGTEGGSGVRWDALFSKASAHYGSPYREVYSQNQSTADDHTY